MAMQKEWKEAKKKLDGLTSKWSNHLRKDLPRFNKALGKKLEKYEQIHSKKIELEEKFKELNKKVVNTTSADEAKKNILLLKKYADALDKLSGALQKAQKEALSVIETYLNEISAKKWITGEKAAKAAFKTVSQVLKQLQKDIRNLKYVKYQRLFNDIISQYKKEKAELLKPRSEAVKKGGGLKKSAGSS